MVSERASEQAFLGVAALLFAATAAATNVWSASMSAMGKTPLCGGRTMSVAWVRMPGETWFGAAVSFLGTAWGHGLRLGFHCSCCSAGLTAILLVIGVMDLRAMAVVAAAITVERLAPYG